MSDKVNIEKLISSKLNEAEVAPSPGAWRKVQRKLRWKQFMQFRPGKPNIYYLGGLLVVSSGLFLLWDNQTEENYKELQLENPESYSLVVEPTEAANPMSKDPGEVNTEGISDEPSTPGMRSVSRDSSDQKDPEVHIEAEPELAEIVTVSEIESSLGQVIKSANGRTLVTYFTCSSVTGCAPLKVEFNNQSINAASFYWIIEGNDQLSVQNPEYLFESAGRFTVTLHNRSSEGHSETYQQVIEVAPNPHADFDLDENFEGINGHVGLQIVNYSEGAIAYSWELLNKAGRSDGQWSSNEFQPTLKLTEISRGSEFLRLIATNEYGCVDTSIQSLPIVIESSDDKIKYPNAFSPNPLGPTGGYYSPHEKRIDLFHPLFTEVPVDYNLNIYTRRGVLVFNSRDIYHGWDGYQNQNRAAGDVYVWMVEGTWENGEEFNLKGDVTLIWNDPW